MTPLTSSRRLRIAALILAAVLPQQASAQPAATAATADDTFRSELRRVIAEARDSVFP